MILPDINLLIYAHNAGAPRHGDAKAWWEKLLNGTVPVGLPWIVISGFIRLTTHPRVLANPMEVGQAVAFVRGWLARPAVRILQPGPRFEQLFFGFLIELGTAANLTTDAHLAALAVENQAELHSNDSDFAHFPGLRWSNPLD